MSTTEKVNGTTTAKTTTMKAHPKYSEMVINAIATLQEKGGSSKLKILKYIVSQYNIEDDTRANTHVKLAIKSGVEKGLLVQAKGTGASGSFKLSDKQKKAFTKATKPKAEATKPKKVVAKNGLKAATAKTPATKTKAAKGDKSPKVPRKKTTDAKKLTAKKTEAAKKAAPTTKKAVAKKTPAKTKKPKPVSTGKKSPKKAAVKKATVTKSAKPAKKSTSKKTPNKATAKK